MMKVFFFLQLSLLLFSCNQKEDKNNREVNPTDELSKKFRFMLGNNVGDFSAKTIDNKIFESKNYKGTYWVVFNFDKRYLNETDFDNESEYDIKADISKTYKQFYKKIHFLAMIEGDVKNKEKWISAVKNIGLEMPCIDNTKYVNDSAGTYKINKQQLPNSFFCNPVIVIIDSQGKVIYHTCGGGGISVFNGQSTAIDVPCLL